MCKVHVFVFCHAQLVYICNALYVNHLLSILEKKEIKTKYLCKSLSRFKHMQIRVNAESVAFYR